MVPRKGEWTMPSCGCQLPGLREHALIEIAESAP
jgi:hypothetical protein